MMHINNEQINLQRSTAKELAISRKNLSMLEIELQNEVERLHQEVLTLHAELVRKNAQIEQLPAQG